MDAVVIKPQNNSDIQFLLDFAKRIGASAKAVDTEDMEDAALLTLVEEGLKTPSVSREEVMKALHR
ncbi:MAG: hypothetical protein LBV41_08835 [Cytophagaceae bacterium]|jgi:hypothetical protein|nr:hypothetical protein [Cytophagaceae bacterium]